MRTPLLLARALGWPEARREHEPTRGLLSFPVPPPTLATGPVSMDLEKRPPPVELLDGVTGERRRVRLNLAGPTLRVRRRRDPITRRLLPAWDWSVWHGCALHAHGEAATGRQALAVGLAALDHTSVSVGLANRPK